MAEIQALFTDEVCDKIFPETKSNEFFEAIIPSTRIRDQVTVNSRSMSEQVTNGDLPFNTMFRQRKIGKIGA